MIAGKGCFACMHVVYPPPHILKGQDEHLGNIRRGALDYVGTPAAACMCKQAKRLPERR